MKATNDKTVLITGCSSGIGLCCALGLKERGYRVFATVRKAEDVARLTEQGLEALQLDLDDSNSINTAVDEVLKRTGGTLYALFNNAGMAIPGAVEDLKRDSLRQQLETNLLGNIELTNRIVPVMREQGYGRIIQNSSLLGLVTLPFRGAYSASKYALEGITDALRLELSNTPIQVSLIEPGPVTSAFRKNAFAQYQAHIDKTHSYHREVYEGMERRLKKPGPAQPFTLPPEAVLKKLVHALEARRPKVRYYVTVPTYMFAFLKHILSFRRLDKVLLRVSKGENK